MKKRTTHAAADVSMEELLGESGSASTSIRRGFQPGERVRGTVLTVGEGYLTVDLGAKIAGFVNIVDLPDDMELPKPGDELDLVFVEMKEGAARLTGKISSAGSAVNESLRMAYASKMPVEGVFEKEVKGGMEVTVCGERAFCPFSQIDLYRDPDRKNDALIGVKTTFFVTEFDPEEHTLVVSRRAVLEKERDDRRAALKAVLREGDLRDGTVTRLMPFGAFVDIGGVEGLVPLREISWDRNVKPEDVLAPGQKVRVAVLAMDWENDRFSLSLKSVQADPWIEFSEDFGPGQYMTGTVVKLMPFGAFVQLQPGIEGLLPIGRIGGGRRISHPREVLSEGQQVDVKIESVDQEQRRISLSLVDARLQALQPGELAVGMTVHGIVEGIRPFGVFVRLSEDKTGLLHIGECDIERGGNPVAKLEAKFEPGTDIEVIVKSLDGDRIGLTLPGKFSAAQAAEEAEASVREYLAKGANDSLGSIGSLFDGLKL